MGKRQIGAASLKRKASFNRPMTYPFPTGLTEYLDNRNEMNEKKAERRQSKAKGAHSKTKDEATPKEELISKWAKTITAVKPRQEERKAKTLTRKEMAKSERLSSETEKPSSRNRRDSLESSIRKREKA